MWKLLLLISIPVVLTACNVTCRNSVYTWEYPEGNVVDSRDLESQHGLIGIEYPQDTVFNDTVSNPNNITTISLYHDTLFLRRTVNTFDHYTSYNYIYIDTNRSSKYYNWLTSFEFSENNISSLESYGVQNVKCADDLKKNTRTGLPKNWLPIYSLNGQYYVYKPSDFGNAGRRILSDSLFIKWYMDGPMPFEIMADKPKRDNSYVLVLKNWENSPMGFFIHCVDTEKEIYVFEERDSNGSADYQLYTPAGNANNFDMIVNTGNEKVREYDFDPVDFESLLGTQKQ